MKLFDPTLRINLNSQNFQLDQFVFLDIEASSLGFGSYPIEVAFASSDGTQNSYLIQPSINWLDKGEWCGGAEQLHGISKQELLSAGNDITRVAKRLNQELKGTLVLCNDITFDGGWISQIFKEADMSVAFHLIDLSALFDYWGELKTNSFKREYAKTMNTNEHRALPDAKRFVQAYLAVESSLRDL